MTKEETTATWQSWLLDAIHKIRYQKQRPNVERISACIRMHHPQYSNEAVQEHIEMCVANKTISKVIPIINFIDGNKNEDPHADIEWGHANFDEPPPEPRFNKRDSSECVLAIE